MKRRDEINRLMDLSDEDLKAEVGRLKQSLFRLNFKLSLGDADSVKNIRREKRTLARVQTILTERASAANR